MRSTNGSSFASAPIARRSRSSSVGCSGKSDATCPSGPSPSSTRSSARRPELLRRTRARACVRPSSPRIRCTSGGARGGRAALRFAMPVVRALVVRRHAALVAPPELDARSSRARARPRARRRAPRRRAAGEHDRGRRARAASASTLRDDRARARRRRRCRLDAHSSPRASSLRALHRRLDRVQERGADARLLELADRGDRRPARRGHRLAQLDRVHPLVAQQLRRAEHRLHDELSSRPRATGRAGCRPRSSPRRAARSTRARSPRRAVIASIASSGTAHDAAEVRAARPRASASCSSPACAPGADARHALVHGRRRVRHRADDRHAVGRCAPRSCAVGIAAATESTVCSAVSRRADLAEQRLDVLRLHGEHDERRRPRSHPRSRSSPRRRSRSRSSATRASRRRDDDVGPAGAEQPGEQRLADACRRRGSRFARMAQRSYAARLVDGQQPARSRRAGTRSRARPTRRTGSSSSAVSQPSTGRPRSARERA